MGCEGCRFSIVSRRYGVKLTTELLSGSEIHHWERNDLGFKRVPALDKCFAILDLILGSRQPLGISEISRRLHFSKSTIYNIVRTLADLEIIERRSDSKLAVGTHFYVLAKAAANKAELVRTVHPYLKTISRESMLSSFLAIRSGMHAIIIDKVEATADIKISYEMGIRLPLLVGAAGKALLSQLSDAELDNVLCTSEPLRLVSDAREDRVGLRNAVIGAREKGIVADMEEHVKGVISLAIPFNTHREDLQAAIWAVGLKYQWRDRSVSSVSKLLKEIAAELDRRFSTV